MCDIVVCFRYCRSHIDLWHLLAHFKCLICIIFPIPPVCLMQNEQLRQDVIDYQRQIDTQKETLLSRRGEESDYRSQLSKKNFELVQYLDEIQVLLKGLPLSCLYFQNFESNINLRTVSFYLVDFRSLSCAKDT